MLLLVRMITRADPEEGVTMNGEDNPGEGKSDAMEIDTVSRAERIRQTLFDYILTDFRARYDFYHINLHVVADFPFH